VKIRIVEFAEEVWRRWMKDEAMDVVLKDLNYFNQSEYDNCGQKCCTRRTSRNNNPLIASLAIDQGIGNAVVTFNALRIPKTSVNRTLSSELALWNGQISGYEN
jgi:hypothetical protein